MGRDIIVVGASQGGVQALQSIVAPLPADLPAAMFIVLHALPSRESLLPRILAKAGKLPVTLAVDGEPIRNGHIYVAPPDNHLLLAGAAVRVLHGPKINGHRPAVDPLFRSAADNFGARVVGVVLTGGRDCGTAGVQDIKRRGGVAIVQDPATAESPDMPRSALQYAAIDYTLPVGEIAALLDRLAREPGPRGDERGVAPVSDPMSNDSQSLIPSDERDWQRGAPTDFSCPNCGGVLREVSGENGDVRLRCRIGHALSMESLVDEQDAALDVALSAALRALSESADLGRRMSRRMTGSPHMRQTYEHRAARAEAEAALIRRVLLSRKPTKTDQG